MKKIFYLTLFLLTPLLKVSGQITIDSVLINIANNNKSIKSNSKYLEARKLEYQVGLSPNNPSIVYDYLIGSPDEAGNQTDFTVTQSFDFPTVYHKKKQLSNEQIKQLEYHVQATRQEILLEAKLVCINLIYQNKLRSELSERKQSTEKLLSDFQKKLEKGDGNIMDVNKAKLQLVEINASFQENSFDIDHLNQKLTELNGGQPLQFLHDNYSSIKPIPEFNNIEAEIQVNDPIRKFLEQEQVIGQNKVELTKSLSLPKLEAGYRYQAIIGQRFNGFHLGLTIPLWENKNTVKAMQTNLLMNEAYLQEHINEHYFDIKRNYDRLVSLRTTLNEYKSLFNSLNNKELLDKSLSLGQISTIEYFMEIGYYYLAVKNYLKTEMEYFKAEAELLKYQL